MTKNNIMTTEHEKNKVWHSCCLTNLFQPNIPDTYLETHTGKILFSQISSTAIKRLRVVNPSYIMYQQSQGKGN